MRGLGVTCGWQLLLLPDTGPHDCPAVDHDGVLLPVQSRPCKVEQLVAHLTGFWQTTGCSATRRGAHISALVRPTFCASRSRFVGRGGAG